MVLVSSQDVLSFYCFLDNSYKNERISHFNAKHWGSLINQKCTQIIYCTNFTPQAMLFWKSIWQSLFMPLIALVELLAFPSRWQMLSSLFKVFSTSLCQHLIHLINGLARTLSKCLSDLLRPDLLSYKLFLFLLTEPDPRYKGIQLDLKGGDVWWAWVGSTVRSVAWAPTDRMGTHYLINALPIACQQGAIGLGEALCG